MYEIHLTRSSVTIQRSNQHKVKIESSCRCVNIASTSKRTQHKKSPKNHLVLFLLLLAIAWLIVIISKSKNIFNYNTPDLTRLDIPSSSNRQTRSITLLGEREKITLFLHGIVLWDIIWREKPMYLWEHFVTRVMKNIEEWSACCSVFTR